MPDFRSFCEKLPSAIGAQIELSPEESNHLIAANRARSGASVQVFDRNGAEGEATLAIANKRKACLTLNKIRFTDPPPYHIALGQALPKGKLVESIIKKATEIGAQMIYPIISSRVESKISNQKAASKNAKWEQAAIEGAKQSGNSRPVALAELTSFDDFLKQASNYELKLIASLEQGAVSLKKHLYQFQASRNSDDSRPTSVIWLIGPEGDFTADEYKRASEHGFLPTTLGPHVMRSETAATYALSITQYELTSR